MLRATGCHRDALCNIARGVGRIVAAMLPAGAPFLPNTSAFSTPYAEEGRADRGSPSGEAAGGTAPAEAAQLPNSLVSDLERESGTYQQGKASMRYRAVPSTQVSRAAAFGSLFAQLTWDRLTSSSAERSLLSSSGHQRIVDTLCRMRGAVLKLGQMLSIQDSNTVPPHITALFERVRDQAFAMPKGQLERTLTAAFHGNPNWRGEIFAHFNDTPVAAASIGQVHHATIKANTVPADPDDDLAFSATGDLAGVRRNEAPLEAAVKVQYPGVAKSIDSDVANLKVLMSLSVLPPGMFVDSILKELRHELSMECQYTMEGAKQERCRRLVDEDDELREAFHVPRVYRSLTTDQVLVSEFVRGVPIDQLAKHRDTPQAFRNYISAQFMRLTLTELFRWRFMQTDPNYANFLYDAKSKKIHLLDFGAAREYDAAFVKNYLDIVVAAARGDRDTIVERSIDMGFLTGREVAEMVNAHVDSVILLGKPFRSRTEPFDFAAENLPAQIKAHVPTMVRLRLRPPPTPVYSLHRGLSGTILLATKFGAAIPSGPLFWQMYEDVKDTF